jgi:hypothetical protein
VSESESESESQIDSDGYGPDPTETAIDRLESDARTLGPSGIERVAEAWHRTAGLRPEDWHEAERQALRAVETANRAGTWDAVRGRLRGETEGQAALVAWQAEHGDTGHRAESALLGAALAILVRDQLDEETYRTLAGPMAAALPWLGPTTE